VAKSFEDFSDDWLNLILSSSILNEGNAPTGSCTYPVAAPLDEPSLTPVGARCGNIDKAQPSPI